MTIEILEYLDIWGRSPFGVWFSNLDARAAAKVTASIDRMGRGLMTNVESVGEGVYEKKLSFGPGYRVYFGMRTDGRVTTAVFLLQGGTKKMQSRDIARAKQYWRDYKKRFRSGAN